MNVPRMDVFVLPGGCGPGLSASGPGRPFFLFRVLLPGIVRAGMAWGVLIGPAPRTAWLLAADGPPQAVERLSVRRGGSVESLEGRVVCEAVDGGALVERPDGRLELLEPGSIVSRGPAVIDDGRTNEEAATAIGKRVLADLPDGFELLATKHYCICHDTSRAYAQWCGAVFERLHDAFVNYWTRAGFPIEPAGRPLVVVIFASQERYAAHAAAALGNAADRVAGYYDLMSNRVITYDLTGSDAVRTEANRLGGARLAVLSNPAASGLVSTLVHEATHQMAFNTGMHRRLAPVPLWVSEGIATYFETPDLGSSQGWRAIGLVNEPRLAHWRKSHQPGDVPRLLADDETFRRPETGVDAYAGAWAMTSFLVQTRRKEFVKYLRILAAKQPLADDAPDLRKKDFLEAFGVEPEAIEPAFLRFMDRRRER